MLPAELMGLNEKEFKQFNFLIKNKLFINQFNSKCWIYIRFVKKEKYISVILNYDDKSDVLFKWYQQLLLKV